MTYQEVRDKLFDYSGHELYQKACELYRQETDSRIEKKSHGNPPSEKVVHDVVSVVNLLMKNAGVGLPFSDKTTLEAMVAWESGQTLVRYGIRR